MPDIEQARHEVVEILDRQLSRRVGQGILRVGVNLEEEPVDARTGSRLREVGVKLPRAVRRCAKTPR